MKKIFVSCPYNHPDPYIVEERMRRFSKVCLHIISRGDMPISPLYNHFLIQYDPTLPTDSEYWKAMSCSMIDMCDEVLVIPHLGWSESVGVLYEVKYAATKLKLIRFSNNDL